MPRSVDLVPQVFKTDYDPTNQLAQDPASVLGKNVKDVGKAIAQLNEKVQAELKRLIDTLLGIAANPIPEIVNWLEDFQNSLSNVLSWIKPGLIPLIPLSQIGEWFPNLILNGGFDDAKTLQDNPDWSWDGTVGRSGPLGSVKAVVAGVMKILHSNDIPVVAGQKMTLEAWAQWSSFSASAGTNPIRLIASHYLNGAPVMSGGQPVRTVIASFQPPTANSTAWEHLSGSFPVPAGIDAVRVSLQVTADATAGLVWFDDANAIKVGKLPLDYVQDLVGQLQQFTDDIGEAFNQLAEKVGLDRFKEFFDTVGGKINAEITDITGRLQAIGADGRVDAAEIFGFLGLSNIPLLPQNKVTDLPDINSWLDQLRHILSGGAITATDPITQAIKDWFAGNNNKTQSLNSAGQLAGSAITGAIAEAQTGVTAVRDAFVNGMIGLLGGGGSGFSNTDAQNQATQLAVVAQQAAAAAAAIQAQYQRNQVTVPSGLMSYITTFGGSDGSALPAEFTGTDLKVRTANGYCGIDASKPDGTYYVTCNKQTTTDDVQTTIVIGDAGGLNSIATYTLFSSDSTDTTGAYLAVNGNTVQVGKYTRSGATFTFASPFMSWSGPLGQGIAVTTYRKTNNWVLDVGGDVKATATNSTVTTGASNRYGGGIAMIRKTASTGWFSGNYQYDSMRLASVYLSDFYARATNYTGARLTRAVGAANTAGPTHPYSLAGNASTTVTGAWGAGAFGIIGFNSDDMVVNTANGTITVNTPGLYYVEHRDPTWTWTAGTAIEPSASALDVVVNTVNHFTLAGDYKLLDGTANTDTGSWGVTGHTPIPVPAFVRLNAGDVIQLGYTVTLKNTGGSSRSGNAVFTLTGTTLGLLGIYKMG